MTKHSLARLSIAASAVLTLFSPSAADAARGGVPGAPAGHGSGIAMEDMGALHNAALDYAIAAVDLDADTWTLSRQLRVAMVDYLCDEHASTYPSGNLPHIGSRDNCEDHAAGRLLAIDRAGPITTDQVLASLDADAPETEIITSLFELVASLGAGRVDLEGFDEQWQLLSEAAQGDELSTEGAEVATLALSLGQSSAHYWTTVRADPDSRWQAIVADPCDDDDTGPSRASWPEIIYADISAGVDSYLGGNWDTDIFWDAAIASLDKAGAR